MSRNLLLIFGIFTLMVSESALPAKWVKFNVNRDEAGGVHGAVYYDAASVQRTGSIVRISFLRDWLKPVDVRLKNIQRSSSWIEDYEVDCQKRLVRSFQTVYYSGRMGQGTAQIHRGQGGWASMDDGDPRDVADFDFACGAKAQAMVDSPRAAQEPEQQASVAVPSTTASTGYEAAVSAMRRKDYRAAYSACLGPAQSGDARCQNNLGILYVNGHVGTRSNTDLRIAADWFGRAAQQNLASAQYNLGAMQERGLGMPRDVNAAKAMYELAAAQGNASARKALDRLGN